MMTRETGDSLEGGDGTLDMQVRAQDEPVRLPGGSGVYTNFLRRVEAKWDK